MAWVFVAGCTLGMFIGCGVTLVVYAVIVVGSRADERMGYE